jgi:hypothetical protein
MSASWMSASWMMCFVDDVLHGCISDLQREGLPKNGFVDLDTETECISMRGLTRLVGRTVKPW